MPTSPSQPHPYDSPTRAHPEPVPLVSPADLVNPMLKVADAMTTSRAPARRSVRRWKPC